MKEVIYYKKLIKSGGSNNTAFLDALIKYYGETPFKTNLWNQEQNHFYIFKKALDWSLIEYKRLSKIALSLRTSDFSDYLKSGYIISEINSSLKTEGVHSSEKIVERIIHQKNQIENKTDFNEIEKLINNMNDAMKTMFNDRLVINEKNIFLIYSILTKGITKDTIEEKQWYRQGEVTIGGDRGVNANKIAAMAQALIDFIQNDNDLPLIVKALVGHYYFELIHPYYDFNGRMGRILHMWILRSDLNEFWKNIYLSEAIYAFKAQYGAIFSKYLFAKKQYANIDLTYFVGKMLELFNTHTKAYIKMKKIAMNSKVKLSRMTRLFIIDMLLNSTADKKWFTLNNFKSIYEGYSEASAYKVLRTLRLSDLCEFKNERPVKFRLK